MVGVDAGETRVERVGRTRDPRVHPLIPVGGDHSCERFSKEGSTDEGEGNVESLR